VNREIVYEARPACALSNRAGKALRTGSIAAALFLSVRTDLTFCGLVGAAGLHEACRSVRAVTPSHQIAEALGSLPFNEVCVAREPSRAALLSALGD
jgi:hypothetical protein